MSRDPAHGEGTFVLLTCEHAGNEIPDAYRDRFEHAGDVLRSHRGYDIGALGVALRMSAALSAPIAFSTISRLVVDLNRSLDQPDLFSEFTRDFTEEERAHLIRAYYDPHRDHVTSVIDALVRTGTRVLHMGVHSCTDVLSDHVRDLDIALLFDDSRDPERQIASAWTERMRSRRADFRYRFNEPYKGADDGFTTTLRTRYDQTQYLGLEVEVRQGLIEEPAMQSEVGSLLASALTGYLKGESPRKDAT